jgi:GNAT superfamily N-acetyltransferase
MVDNVGTLRGGRLVAVRRPLPGEHTEITRLLDAAKDPRREAFARAPEAAIDPPELVARYLDGGELIGYAAWLPAAGGARADLFCAVDPAATGVGVGTLLLRSAASAAAAGGVSTLRVALHPPAHALAAMLRDCGLSSHWDLDYPVAHVELLLDRRRPGWATP